MIEAARLTVNVDSDTSAAESGLARVSSGIASLARGFGGLAQVAGGVVLGAGLLDAPSRLFGMAEAAAADAASMATLQQAVTNAEGAFQGHAKAIEDAIVAGQQLGFSDDATRQSLSLMTAMTGDADEALRRLSSAQNLSRGTGMDLVTASKLLGKVSEENVTALRRYGIAVEDGATAQDLLNAVDAKFKGQAGAFADSDAGKFARLRDQIDEAQEALGAKLLPVFAGGAELLSTRVMPVIDDLIDRLSGPLNYAFVLARDSVLTFVQAIQGNWADDGRIRPLHRAIGLIATIIHDQVIPAAMAFWDFVTGTLVPGITTAFGGLVSVIQAAFAGDWSTVANLVLSGISQALAAAGGLVWDVGGWLVGLFLSVNWANVATTILTGLGAALTAAGTGIWNAGAWLVSVFASIDYLSLGSTIVNGIVAGATAVVDFGQRIAAQLQGQLAAVDWTGAAQAIQGGIAGAMQSIQGQSWFGDLATQVQPLIDALAPLLDRILPSLQQSFDNLKTAFAGVGDALAGADFAPVIEALETLGKVAGTILGVALIALVEAVEKITEVLAVVLPASAEIAVGAIESIAGIVNTIASVVGGMIDIVRNLLEGDWSGAWQAAETMVSGVVDGIGQILSGLPAVIGGYLLDAAQAGITALAQFVTDSGAQAAGVVAAIAAGLLGLPGQVQGKFAEARDQGIAILIDLIAQMPGKGVEIIAGLISGLASALPGVVGMLAGIRDAVLGVFGDAASWLYSAGASIVQGLVDGITSKVGAVADALGAITDAIPNWKGPPEKDRRLLQPTGQMIMQGLATGIDHGSRFVRAALETTTADVQQYAENTVAQTVDWSWLFVGLDRESEDFAKAAAQNIADFLSGLNITALASGDLLKDAQSKLADLLNAKAIAEQMGLGAEIIANIQREVDAAQSEVNAIGAAMGTEIVQGIADALKSGEVSAALADFREDVIAGLDLNDVQGAFDDLNVQLSQMIQLQRAALELGDTETATRLQTTIDDLTNRITLLDQVVGTESVQAWLDWQSQVEAAEAATERMAAAQERLNQSTVTAIQGLAQGGDAVGDFFAGLVSDVDAAQNAFDMGLLLHVPPEVLEQLGNDLSEAEEILNQGTRALQTALLSGLVDPEMLQALAEAGGEWFRQLYDSLFGPGALAELESGWNDLTDVSLSALADLIPQMGDGADQIVDTLVGAITSGAVSVDEAFGLFADASGDQIDAIIEQLQSLEDELTVQLAEALLTGTDPSGIQANIDAILALLGLLEEQANQTTVAITNLATLGTNNLSRMGGNARGVFSDLAVVASASDAALSGVASQMDAVSRAAQGVSHSVSRMNQSLTTMIASSFAFAGNVGVGLGLDRYDAILGDLIAKFQSAMAIDPAGFTASFTDAFESVQLGLQKALISGEQSTIQRYMQMLATMQQVAAALGITIGQTLAGGITTGLGKRGVGAITATAGGVQTPTLAPVPPSPLKTASATRQPETIVRLSREDIRALADEMGRKVFDGSQEGSREGSRVGAAAGAEYGVRRGLAGPV